jgi:hypothetical protein
MNDDPIETARRYSELLGANDLTHADMGRFFDVHSRTSHRWADGSSPAPSEMLMLLAIMAAVKMTPATARELAGLPPVITEDRRPTEVQPSKAKRSAAALKAWETRRAKQAGTYVAPAKPVTKDSAPALKAWATLRRRDPDIGSKMAKKAWVTRRANAGR